MFDQIKNYFHKDNHPHKALFITMLVFGFTGLAASFTLAVEEFHLLKNPDATLSCSINLVLNCSTVMKTWQASVFGFPNMFIGLIGYPMVIMIALLGLSRVTFPRWFAIGMEIGYSLGALLAYWLFFNSLYAIQVLCPWCLVVTFSTTLIWATATRYNVRNNTFRVSKARNKIIQNWLDKDFDKFIVACWIVLLVALVILKFGDGLIAQLLPAPDEEAYNKGMEFTRVTPETENTEERIFWTGIAKAIDALSSLEGSDIDFNEEMEGLRDEYKEDAIDLVLSRSEAVDIDGFSLLEACDLLE